MNLAVSGYGTDQQLLLGLYENDVRENMLAFQGRYPKPYYGRRVTARSRCATPPSPACPSRPRLGRAAHAHGRGATRAFGQRSRSFARRCAPDASTTVPPEAPPGIELTAALVGRLAASVPMHAPYAREGLAFLAARHHTLWDGAVDAWRTYRAWHGGTLPG